MDAVRSKDRDGPAASARTARERNPLDMSSNNGLTAAFADFKEGAQLAPLWWRLGIEQTTARYRRTLLGPFWMAASTMGTGFALALIFGGVLGGNWRTSVPFILTGVMIWVIISGAITEGAGTFMHASGQLQIKRMPLSFHVFLQMHNLLITFLHQVVAYWIVMISLGFFTIPHWQILFSVPVILAIGFFAAFPLGFLATRYRDVAQFIGILMGVMFLLTPVFWRRATIADPNLVWIVDYNPFAYLLEIIRQPFLGHPAELKHWAVSLLILLISAAGAVATLVKFRRRVVFWL
jgi:ABC-type polysaccharide/polyol phosphate export permease